MDDGETRARGRPVRLRRGVTVVALAGAIVFAASFAYRPDPVDLGSVAEATERAGTARVEIDLTTESKRRSLTMDVRGEIDFASSRLRLQVDMEDATGWSGEVEVVRVAGTAFYRRDGDAGWTGGQVDPEQHPLGVAPDQLLTFLESAREVTTLGEETLDGETVTRYRAVVDLAAFDDDRVPPRVRLDPIEVWVDGDGLARRIAYGSYEDAPSGSSTVTWQAAVRFYDFGVPVDVEAPPSDQVTDGGGSQPHWSGGN